MTAVEPKTDSITVHNPANGTVVGSVPVDGPDTVAAKARAGVRATGHCRGECASAGRLSLSLS
jgi:hypothetical protein